MVAYLHHTNVGYKLCGRCWLSPSLVRYMMLKRPSCICFAFINHESVRCRISDTCRYPTLPLYIHHLFGRPHMVYWVITTIDNNWITCSIFHTEINFVDTRTTASISSINVLIIFLWWLAAIMQLFLRS